MGAHKEQLIKEQEREAMKKPLWKIEEDRIQTEKAQQWAEKCKKK